MWNALWMKQTTIHFVLFSLVCLRLARYSVYRVVSAQCCCCCGWDVVLYYPKPASRHDNTQHCAWLATTLHYDDVKLTTGMLNAYFAGMVVYHLQQQEAQVGGSLATTLRSVDDDGGGWVCKSKRDREWMGGGCCCWADAADASTLSFVTQIDTHSARPISHHIM